MCFQRRWPKSILAESNSSVYIDPLELAPPAPAPLPPQPTPLPHPPPIPMEEGDGGVYSMLSRSFRRLFSGNQNQNNQYQQVLQSPPSSPTIDRHPAPSLIDSRPAPRLTAVTPYVPPKAKANDIYIKDCYITRNGERLSSIQFVPASRDFDPGNYHQFLETIGCIGTPFATPISSDCWHLATPLYAFDLSQNCQAYNTDWHPQAKMGLYRIQVDFNEVQFSMLFAMQAQGRPRDQNIQTK